MLDYIINHPNVELILVLGILVVFLTIEIVGGFLQSSKRNSGDWLQELGGYLILAFLTKPGIVLAVSFIGLIFFPQYSTLLSEYNLWIVMIGYLLIDDFFQYWYHRSAHEYPFLWKLHRAHHQAEEMGFFVSYRNAALYYVLMPNIWWIALVTFLGGGQSVAIGLVLKQFIIIGSHSNVHYDKILYKYKFLNPIATIWERIFITPAFHHAHHGKTKRDGISDPNGNFGNTFSIWDQVFNTATFTRQFPTEFGLENDPKESWTVSYLWPFITAKDKTNEMSRGHVKQKTTRNEPSTIHLQKGEKYLYCQCGMSKNQPFCDSSHHGTKFKPLLFEAKRTGNARLCNCKLTGSSPFCDDSHVKMSNEA